MNPRFLIVLLLVLSTTALHAQRAFRLSGNVYDSSRTYPLHAVTVMSTGSGSTLTDSTGRYSITVTDKDSVWFSYLNKPTRKFPVAKILNSSQFDVALKVPVELKEVVVKQRNYKMDSIQNRMDYEKVFNWRKPGAETLTSMGPMGAGFDVQEIIRAFQFRKNRSMLHFQERLLQQERDKFIDHRFNKSIIRRLTGLTGEELDRFAISFRPTYEFVLYANDYDLHLYIKERYKLYLRHKAL